MNNNMTIEQLAHRLDAVMRNGEEDRARLLAQLGDSNYLLSLAQQENAQLKQEIKELKNVSEEDEES